MRESQEEILHKRDTGDEILHKRAVEDDILHKRGSENEVLEAKDNLILHKREPEEENSLHEVIHREEENRVKLRANRPFNGKRKEFLNTV